MSLEIKGINRQSWIDEDSEEQGIAKEKPEKGKMNYSVILMKTLVRIARGRARLRIKKQHRSES